LLLPSFRSYQVEDPSIANVEEIKVSLSEDTIDELLVSVTKEMPDFPVDRFKGFLGRERTVYRVVPLKAGTTALITSAPPGGGGRPGGGGGGRGGDVWGSSQQEKIGLVVTAYEPGLVAIGEERYTTPGEGSLKACESCHAGGENGAPPHELGRIMEINDDLAYQWITTGKAGGRVAKINHAWEFGSEEQQKGIVPYVRSKQTHDVEALTKLEFEQRLQNFDFKGGPGGRP
jgi:hypothetical protein